MKHALYLLIVLLAVPFIAAQAEPFVQDGQIVATIVVGEQAPPQDVILGAEIVGYLQQFASETRTGLSATSDQVTLSNDGVFILIGLAENNPLVAEVLGTSDEDSLSGPYVQLYNHNIMVISGQTQTHVQTAANLFREGERSFGTVKRAVAGELVPPEPPVVIEDDYAKEAPIELYEEEMKTAPGTPQQGGVDREVPVPSEVAPAPYCQPRVFCVGDALKQVSETCQETVVEYCAYGCDSGSCQQGFFARYFGWLAFWN